MTGGIVITAGDCVALSDESEKTIGSPQSSPEFWVGSIGKTLFKGAQKPWIESKIRGPISDVRHPRQQPRVDSYARLLSAEVIETNLSVGRSIQPTTG